MTRPSERKRGQGQKSKPKQARPRLNENADPKVGKSDAIPLITPNVNDSLVIQKLSTTAAGALAVEFARAKSSAISTRVKACSDQRVF